MLTWLKLKTTASRSKLSILQILILTSNYSSKTTLAYPSHPRDLLHSIRYLLIQTPLQTSLITKLTGENHSKHEIARPFDNNANLNTHISLPVKPFIMHHDAWVVCPVGCKLSLSMFHHRSPLTCCHCVGVLELVWPRVQLIIKPTNVLHTFGQTQLHQWCGVRCGVMSLGNMLSDENFGPSSNWLGGTASLYLLVMMMMCLSSPGYWHYFGSDMVDLDNEVNCT